MRIALFEPDIPQNVGTIIRLCACLGVSVDIIEPCGFPFSGKDLRRSGMDYLAKADVTTHIDWRAFSQTIAPSRLILLSTKSASPYTDFEFRQDDILMFGRESAGVPDAVHGFADARITIPMAADMRSLNVATAAAMTLGEALRQTDLLPKQDPDT